MAKLVKIRFQNGINRQIACDDILNELKEDFIFEESDQPDFILFGPYGNDVPVPGNYTRIGYFCENIKPDLSICEWAFGVPPEREVNSTRYKRIQWHGLNPDSLVKSIDYNAEEIAASKSKFCNFLYSHRVPYREAFFKQLSRYKRVDAPGRSMNNMGGIDALYQGNKWEVKKHFFSDYKFTISFENDVYPGYQTEKLYDAMLASSIPIYCGDLFVGDIFNTESFVNTLDYLPRKNQSLVTGIGKLGQMDFEDIRPAYLTSAKSRVKRKGKSYLRAFKTRLQFANMDFSPVIEKIIELDSQPGLYVQMLKQPWFKNNEPPAGASLKNRWVEIFNSR